MKFRRVARRVPRKRAVWVNIPFGSVAFSEVVGNQDLLVPRTGKRASQASPKRAVLRAIVGRSSGNRRPSAQPAATVSGASTWLGPMKQLCLFSPPRACPRSPGSGRAHARPRAASQTASTRPSSTPRRQSTSLPSASLTRERRSRSAPNLAQMPLPCRNPRWHPAIPRRSRLVLRC